MIDKNKVKLITLSENTAADIWFLGEWGFSILVDIDGYRVLFDTGPGKSVVYNADVLGINLSTIDKVVLSHGHMDHTGGLRDLLERLHFDQPDKKVRIIAHPEVMGLKYIRNSPEEDYFYRGVPFRKEEIERLGAEFKFSEEPVWLSDDIVASGEIPMLNNYESIAPICFLKTDKGFIDDPVNDDQALYIKTSLGLIVILGCGHHGLINTINHAQKITGIKEVYMAIGGTHLAKASDYQMLSTIAELKRIGIKKLGVSHCTGMASACRLSFALGDKFFHNNAGSIVDFNGEMRVKAF